MRLLLARVFVLAAVAVVSYVQPSTAQTSSPYHTNPLPQVSPQLNAEPTPRPAAGSKVSRAEKELLAADIEFAKQTAARRLEGWMDAFAPDAAVLHDGKTVSGTQALRQYYEPVFANKNFTLTWTPTNAEASKDGSLGYTYGAYEAKNGDRISHGMYLTIWRKINGKWKVVMDTGSAAAK
jgi:ketosteroid isomerase-like protein